jgi:predicted nucleic acid-binding protein
MPAADVFFDTNVLLYLLSADSRKADIAERLLSDGGIISVQVLNEFAAVASHKLKMKWAEITEILVPIKALCTVTDLSLATHEQALLIAERYGFSIYDSLIVSAAIAAGCKKLYSEDLQHGQRINRSLIIDNPFK